VRKEAGAVPGKDEYRANFEFDDAEYAGFVVWPFGAIADIWLAPDQDRAEQVEKEYAALWKQYGKAEQGAQLVQRKANAIVGLDDQQPPTPDEAETLDGCLQPGG
jgi:hypothetical protein